MTLTYTNRRGVTYYLCKTLTKTGKPRYYVAQEPKGEPVPEMPEGYEIRESVNGVVSVARARPHLLRPDEIETVAAALRRHPRADYYRLDARHDCIQIHEPESDIRAFGGDDSEGFLALIPGGLERFRKEQLARARYTPVMRFVLADPKRRTFQPERMTYRGAGGWRGIGRSDAIFTLVRKLIPKLGTDEFF